MRIVLILSILGLVMASCYEKQEGCLDFRASNYDFGADEPCEDCCTFPTMKIGVTHNWGDTVLMSDSVYTNLADQNIRIVDAKFYLSDIALTNGGEAVTVKETITVEDANMNSSEITAANKLVQSMRFTYDLGTFEQAAVFDGMSFKLGIDGNYFAEELTTDDASLYDESTLTYTNFQMTYVAEQVSPDTLLFELVGRDFVSSHQLAAIIDLPLGVNFEIPIVVDYQALLNDIDIENMNSDTEKSKVFANFQQFFNF